MKSTFKIVTLRDIIDQVLSGKLNPDPISQRPATSVSPKKSQSIIFAIRAGYGVGMITVRDIENDPEMQLVYPGVKYTVIDGGHRVRALVEYYTNKFAIEDEYFKDLTTGEQKDFMAIEIAMESIICTSAEAIQIFRTRNKTTDVNFIEMIMCDDQSFICREVRSRTKYYKEYKNKVHPLFTSIRNDNDEHLSDSFDSAVNPRRKWDEYVFIAMLRSIGGGIVDAGQREIEALVASEYDNKNPVSNRTLEVVDRFLTDARKFRFSRGKKFNGDVFAAFLLIWFGIYKKGNFKITDIDVFKSVFMDTYTKLTGTSDNTYDNKIVEVDGEAVNLKYFVRTNLKNFSNSVVQKHVAEFFFKEMGQDCEKYGITFLDKKRSLTTKEREEQLARQGYKCAITGKPLTLEDSVWGHDVAWADGGKTADGKVVHKDLNTAMGQLTIDEYKLILELRKKQAA